MSQRVLLFDVDGVLVEPLGYRMVTRATINAFAARMGLGDSYPGDEIMDLFESQSITSEWDITALCLAAMFDAAAASQPDLRLPGDVFAACDCIRENGILPMVVGYEPLVTQLGHNYQPGMSFAELGYVMSRPSAFDPLFPHLVGHPLLEALLAHSRDVRQAPVTRVFQQYAIGSQAFQETYGFAAEVETESYLRAYDQPLLEADLKDGLLRGWGAGEHQLAAYTVRPSLVRLSDAPQELPYSPEAELALEAVGMEMIPLVGYGQVCRLASQIQIPADRIAKPSMIHALGAIGAAVTRDERQALTDAAAWAAEPEKPGMFASFPPLEIYVFEDSPWSIRAVQQAGELLAGIGIPAHVTAYGISRSPTKVVMLIEAGAEIAPDVNSALRRALGLPA